MLCSQESGWRSRARRQPSCRRGGTVPVPGDSPLGVLHLPVLGCRSCPSIVAHVRGGSFAKLPRVSSSWLVRGGFGSLLKVGTCQVRAPPGSGPCRAWWQGSWCRSVGGSAPTIRLGCTHYSTGNSWALIQLFGCLCLAGLWISLGEGSSHLHVLCRIRWCR